METKVGKPTHSASDVERTDRVFNWSFKSHVYPMCIIVAAEDFLLVPAVSLPKHRIEDTLKVVNSPKIAVPQFCA